MPLQSWQPRELFLTRGVGRAKAKLASFEEALRDAGIAHLNLVLVSSIFPPGCRVISRHRGLELLKPGQITFCVMSRNETDEHRRLIASSVGLAIPADRRTYGYISEHHTYGQTEEETGDYAEDLAATMLATTLGVEFDPELNWDEKREIFKISRKIVRTRNIVQSAIGSRNQWTTVVSAAVFVR
jgi:arginine decarboxylase